jgi:hypothetical protein
MGTVATSVISSLAAAMAVAVKTTGDSASPVTEASARCVPLCPPRVNVVAAMPSVSVTDDAGDTLPPPSATLHVTVTPATGSASASVTLTRSGWARAVPTKAC